jgi:transposase
VALLGAPLPDRELRQTCPTITANKTGIVATLTHRLSNARIEAINTTLRLITRRAYRFHTAQPLIALAILTVGGLRPALPGRG